jgi:hypothetical protein
MYTRIAHMLLLLIDTVPIFIRRVPEDSYGVLHHDVMMCH